jgi:hypothetical protein
MQVQNEYKAPSFAFLTHTTFVEAGFIETWTQGRDLMSFWEHPRNDGFSSITI